MCWTVQLLHDLYLPEGGEARHLAEALLSPSLQAVLHGVRLMFVSAMGRIAFAPEPDWLVNAMSGAAPERYARRRTQLETAAGAYFV